MKEFAQNILVICLIILGHSALADVGETHALKNERSQIIRQIRQLEADSLPCTTEIKALYGKVLILDNQIFASMEESVARESALNVGEIKAQQWMVYLAFVSILVALIFAVMLLMVRKKIMDQGYSGLFAFYRDLTLDFATQVSPDTTTSNRMLRVNVVVLIGLVIMGISVVSFLISTF